MIGMMIIRFLQYVIIIEFIDLWSGFEAICCEAVIRAHQAWDQEVTSALSVITAVWPGTQQTTRADKIKCGSTGGGGWRLSSYLSSVEDWREELSDSDLRYRRRLRRECRELKGVLRRAEREYTSGYKFLDQSAETPSQPSVLDEIFEKNHLLMPENDLVIGTVVFLNHPYPSSSHTDTILRSLRVISQHPRYALASIPKVFTDAQQALWHPWPKH